MTAIPAHLQQMELLLASPSCRGRAQLYALIAQVYAEHIQPLEPFGLMMRDRQGQPIVGSLEQWLVHSQIRSTGQVPPLLLRMLGGTAVLQRAERQWWARQAIRQINHALGLLLSWHQQHMIYLNREDLQQLARLHDCFAASPLAGYFALSALAQLFASPHPDVVQPSALLWQWGRPVPQH